MQKSSGVCFFNPKTHNVYIPQGAAANFFKQVVAKSTPEVTKQMQKAI